MDKISVVIVTYNNEETIENCLNSLLKFESNIEIVVVDNKSQDKTLDRLKKYDDKIKVFPQDDNLGFSKGNNIGAKKSSADYLVFLNPDTFILKENSIRELKDVLVENKNYGLVGPAIKLTSGEIQKTARNLPGKVNAFKEYILGIQGSYDFYEPEGNSLCEVESVVGACMVIRKELFEKIGGWDEKFFLYFEDLDICKRIREAGLKVGFYPGVVIGHVLGVSGKKAKTNVLLHQSAKIYHGLFSYYLIQFILRVGGKLK